MQHHAADHLDVEMAHAEDTLAGFADDGEGFGQQVVERLAPARRSLNSAVFGPQRLVGERGWRLEGR